MKILLQMRRHGEKGLVLPLALVALTVGTLLAIPFSRAISTRSMSSRAYAESINERYTSDAGVEDAIWNLAYGTLTSQLPSSGASDSYTTGTSTNGSAAHVQVIRDYVIIASESFESNNWTGGSGWLGAWQTQSLATITQSSGPHEGQYHVQMRGTSSLVKRAVDLSSQYNVRLRFWAKAVSFISGESAYCDVSSDGSQWTTVQTWANGDDDNVYRFYDIDLSSFDMSEGQFWIAFQTDMGGTSSYFYVDSVTLIRKFPGPAADTVSDNFESGNWSGGTGWSNVWASSGQASITPSELPHQGNYHVRMKGQGARIERRADLSGREYARLRFWIKPLMLEAGDVADVLVSNNGTTWYSLKTWTVDDDNGDYHFVELDIPSECLTAGFRVAFLTDMSNASDRLYVDDLSIVGGVTNYEVTSTISATSARADVSIGSGIVSIHTWQTRRELP